MAEPADLEAVTVMASRTPSNRSYSRQPRGIVQVDGATIEGWISFEVSSNTFFEADTYRIEFAASLLPVDRDANWFSQQTETFVEIFAGFPDNPDQPDIAQLTSLIYGRVDEISYDPVSTLLTLSGRDLTGAFIDKRLEQDYHGAVASAVAGTLATSHGLTARGPSTTSIVGTYYVREQVLLQANRSEWDLICYLARQEGFVAYVSGKTLYFGPDPIPTSSPFEIKWAAPTNGGPPKCDVIDLAFSHSQTVAKGISVTVRSASLRTKSPVVQSYPIAPKSISPGKASPYGATQQYYFTVPAGHDSLYCAAFAEKKYKEILSHEMKLRARLPADSILDTKTLIRVTGTGTAWDQEYFPRSITREMSVDSGYVMNLEAQNQATDNPSGE